MPTRVVEKKTTTAGSMEASSLRANFAESPSDTAQVESPRVLLDTTRDALKKKLLEAKDRLAKMRPANVKAVAAVDKIAIKTLPDAEAEAVRGTIKRKLSDATRAAESRLRKAWKILSSAKCEAAGREPAVVEVPSESEASSPTKSPSRSSSSRSPSRDSERSPSEAEDLKDPPIAIEVFNGLGILGAELKKAGFCGPWL